MQGTALHTVTEKCPARSDLALRLGLLPVALLLAERRRTLVLLVTRHAELDQLGKDFGKIVVECFAVLGVCAGQEDGSVARTVETKQSPSRGGRAHCARAREETRERGSPRTGDVHFLT